MNRLPLILLAMLCSVAPLLSSCIIGIKGDGVGGYQVVQRQIEDVGDEDEARWPHDNQYFDP